MALSRLAALTVLGVDSDASRADITQAYRRLARELHPDRCPAPDAAERFARLRDAYERAMEATPSLPAACEPHSGTRPSLPDRGAAEHLAPWPGGTPGRRPPIIAGPARVDPPRGWR
jgi:hypothetical protein